MWPPRVVGRFIAVDHLKPINASGQPNGSRRDNKTSNEGKATGCELNVKSMSPETAAPDVFGRTRKFVERVQRPTTVCE